MTYSRPSSWEIAEPVLTQEHLVPQVLAFDPGYPKIDPCPFQVTAHIPSPSSTQDLPSSHPTHHLPVVTLTSPGYGLFML